jgi:hypothetical protein
MIEQQQHLVNLINQRQSLLDEINSSQKEMIVKRELMLKVQGAIEYLQQIGTTVPETESENSEESVSDIIGDNEY